MHHKLTKGLLQDLGISYPEKKNVDGYANTFACYLIKFTDCGMPRLEATARACCGWFAGAWKSLLRTCSSSCEQRTSQGQLHVAAVGAVIPQTVGDAASRPRALFFSPWRVGCETRPGTRRHRLSLVLIETTLISDMLPLKCLLHVTRPKAIFGGHRFEKECVAWRSGYVSERRSPERQPECQTPAVLKRRPRYTDGVTKARRD